MVYPIEEILEVRAYLILCSSNHIGDYPRGNDGVEGRVRIITFYWVAFQCVTFLNIVFETLGF